MDNIKVSLASEKDRSQLLECFKHYKDKRSIEKRVDCYLSHNFTIVAKEKRKIAGILQWYVKEDPKTGVAEFEEVFVSEAYRRRGIGSSLVDFAIKSVRDHFGSMSIKPRKIFLFVGKDNTSARRLYEKHGFKLVSEVGNLFSDNEAELFYSFEFEK